MPCQRPSQPAQSPWLTLKNAADELAKLPDQPLSELQNAFSDYKLILWRIICLDGPDRYQVAWRMVEMANTESAASIRSAVQESLGAIP